MAIGEKPTTILNRGLCLQTLGVTSGLKQAQIFPELLLWVAIVKYLRHQGASLRLSLTLHLRGDFRV